MFKLLIAGIISLGTMMPAQAVVPTESSNELGLPSNAIALNGRVCTSSRNGRLSLREGPGTGYRKIIEIPNNKTVQVIDGAYGADGFYWYYVKYNYYGWVRSDYICGV